MKYQGFFEVSGLLTCTFWACLDIDDYKNTFTQKKLLSWVNTVWAMYSAKCATTKQVDKGRPDEVKSLDCWLLVP